MKRELLMTVSTHPGYISNSRAIKLKDQDSLNFAYLGYLRKSQARKSQQEKEPGTQDSLADREAPLWPC